MTRIRLRIEYNSGTCFPDQMSRFAADFDAATRTGRYQAFFCTSHSEKPEPYCLAGESFINLDVISRGLRRLGWKRKDDRKNDRDDPARAWTDHETDYKATLIWGNGDTQTLWIRGKRAPIDVRIAQDLIQSLISPVWTLAARRGECLPGDSRFAPSSADVTHPPSRRI